MITAEQIKEFEEKYQRIYVLRGIGDPCPWEVVLRKPTRAEYKQYRAQSHNPATLPDAQEILVRKCCVHPPREAFDALLEDWPGIPEAASKAVSTLAGLGAAEDTK